MASFHSNVPKLEEENKLDPDDGNSTLCAACRLPIFSTPFTSNDDHLGRVQVMHDKCANHLLPAKLEAHPLHPWKELILHQQHSTTSLTTTTTTTNNYNKIDCSRCDSICGSSYYKCPDDDCEFRLDLACALSTINWILHRSHPHRLTAIKGKSLSSLLCAACGTRHQQPPGPEASISTWQVSYVCIPCDFWLHPDCSILPNAIQIDDKLHPHPLLLRYLTQGYVIKKCGICGHEGKFSNGRGIYVCFDCVYGVHTKCVVYSNPGHHIHFEPVKIRDAQVPGLLHLPMHDESTSVMAHILMKSTTAITFINGISSTTNSSSSSMILSKEQIHEHHLILHDHDDPAAGGGVARICNACVHLISPSDPFYSCSTTFGNNSNNNEVAGGCRDFFLHRCCAHLPTTLPTTQRQRHNRSHPLTLISKPNLPGRPFNMFMCKGCKRQCNGFAYACEKCDDYYVDVVCAFMNTSITHDGHANSHILRPIKYSDSGMCICCGHRIIDRWFDIGYKCNNCRVFRIHGKCALLPDTVTHKFDTHPLKLITTTETLNTDDHQLVRGEQMFCEICEKYIDDRRTWYYGCKECDQYFHTGCIPCVDELSKIKFGFTIRVECHGCPLMCVRALSVDGYRCGCGRCDRIIIRESDELAFECSECYFRIRKECAAREIIVKKNHLSLMDT